MILERSWNSTGSHSKIITSELASSLKEAQLSTANIEQILVGVGPGSFTGIRIGLNLAKSLSYSHSLPIYEYSTLLGLAELSKDVGKPVLSVINAFRDLVYCAIYDQTPEGHWEVLLEPSALTLDEIREKLKKPEYSVVGDAAETFVSEIKLDSLELNLTGLVPKAKSYLSLKCRQTEVGPSPKDWKHAAPLYVRASEAEEKLKIKS